VQDIAQGRKEEGRFTESLTGISVPCAFRMLAKTETTARRKNSISPKFNVPFLDLYAVVF